MRSAVTGPTRMATMAQRAAMSPRGQMAHLADTIEVAMRKLSSANSPPGSAASGRTKAVLVGDCIGHGPSGGGSDGGASSHPRAWRHS